MERTYYIVEHGKYSKMSYRYSAHKRGLSSIFNCFNYSNVVVGSGSDVSADNCESNLLGILEYVKHKPKVVRIVRY